MWSVTLALPTANAGLRGSARQEAGVVDALHRVVVAHGERRQSSSVPENGSSTAVAMMLKVVAMTAMPAAFAALSINANGNTALMA